VPATGRACFFVLVGSEETGLAVCGEVASTIRGATRVGVVLNSIVVSTLNVVEKVINQAVIPTRIARMGVVIGVCFRVFELIRWMTALTMPMVAATNPARNRANPSIANQVVYLLELISPNIKSPNPASINNMVDMGQAVFI